MKFPVSPADSASKRLDVSESSAASSITDQARNDSSATATATANNGEKHVFSDPAIAEHWRTVYDEAKYENRHRFDPTFTWTAEEEKKLVRKLPEIGMNTNDFNYGQTIFLVSFLAAELPSGLIAKRVGADNYIPFAMIGWSIVAGSQAFLHSKAGFYVIKALIGLLMGGFIPDVVLWLSYFYKSGELPVRLAWFWTATSVTNILGSLIAGGVLQMRGINGWSGWRWLFLIEGLMTLVVGIFSIVLMPAGPCQTKSWFRGKDGWFSEREEFIMVNRLLRDDPSKGDMNNRQGVGPKLLFKTLKEWELWPIYLMGIIIYVPPAPPTTYLSLILRELGFSVFKANLLTIPSQFLFAVNLVLVSMLSERLKERAAVSSLSNIWMLPWLAALVALGARASPWTRYALLTGLLSYPYCHAILVGWNARNSNAVRTRAVSAAIYNMFVQSGNIISTNIYREDDKPLYRRGNTILLAITCFNISLFYAAKLFYVWRNSVRERRWSAMTPEEQAHYRLHSTDEGMKRLDFRFAH
ncbi:putative transporter [Escovopsis weberi]|uniref:Putative transporter n=1 Tax=Escovopsis weberi TaxID=150374 RepID=A0A0M9VUE6_ESCWE|nr:putative transporter [Escovopsis weberi]